jgi:hypothetical protein
MSGLMPFGPLAYEGTIATPYIARTTDPTTTNYTFNVPTIWINTSTGVAFILLGKPLNVANWQPFSSSSGEIFFLQGNTGGSVGPNGSGVIQVVGDGTTIDIAGDPSTHTLTASYIGSMTGITWNSVTSASPSNPIPIAASNGYICGGSSLVTFTLPSSPSLGDEFVIVSNTAQFEIFENGSQIIKVGTQSSTAGSGNAQSQALGTFIEFLYVGSNVFLASAPQGSITLN